MRRRFLAANWKMHKTVSEAVDFVKAFRPRVEGSPHEIAIAPPFTALFAVGRALAGSNLALAAQNVHDEAKGAFTGEVAPGMLADVGCAWAIVGHSERRALFGESSEFVARKAAALFAHGIRPIV
jgi:triosephosphate isomerase